MADDKKKPGEAGYDAPNNLPLGTDIDQIDTAVDIPRREGYKRTTTYNKERDLPGDEPDNVDLQPRDEHGGPTVVSRVADWAARHGLRGAGARRTSASGAVTDGGGYDDILKHLDEVYRFKSPEEIQEARKKEKRERLFGAIGDGLNALANLYVVNKGAPSQDPNRTTLSEKINERYEKMRKEDQANRKEWLSTYYKIRSQQRADKIAETNARNAARRLDIYEQDQERKNKIAESQIQLNKAREDAAKGDTPEAQAKVVYWETKTNALAQGMDDAHAKSVAEIEYKRAQTRLANERANHVGDSGSNKGYTTTRVQGYDEQGNKVTTTTKTPGTGGAASGGKTMPGTGGGKKMPGTK